MLEMRKQTIIFFILLIIEKNSSAQVILQQSQEINEESKSIDPVLKNVIYQQIIIKRFNLNTQKCENVFKFKLPKLTNSLDLLYLNDEINEISHISQSDSSSPIPIQLLVVKKLTQLFLITFKYGLSLPVYHELLIKVSIKFILVLNQNMIKRFKLKEFEHPIMKIEPKWLFFRAYVLTRKDQMNFEGSSFVYRIYEIDLYYKVFALVTEFKSNSSKIFFVPDPFQGSAILFHIVFLF